MKTSGPGVNRVRRTLTERYRAVAWQNHSYPSSSYTLLPTVNLFFFFFFLSGYLSGFAGAIVLDKKIEKHLRIAKSLVVWTHAREAAEIQV